MSELDERRWADIDALLDRALDAPPAERPELVAAACAGDAELEARVHELLAAAHRVEGSRATRLASLAPAVYQETLERLDDSLRLRAGSELGPYRIIESIGAGGMGEVYLAERADGEFKRRVAIKILSGLAADPTRYDRFRRERQILADLQHDHIALLLDGGVSEDGRPYFVLQYVDGVAITRYCAEHRLGQDARIALLLQACEAVQYAHSRGVVHRDLKPANLLVCDHDDGPPHLSVLDFGIARLAGEGDLTQAGDVLGTPAYMAPEQARGDIELVDRRADVFALGVVLYELLCDRRPFEGATPAEVHAAVLRADPARPRTRVPTLPRDLEIVTLTCLERSPERRYPSVRALAEDLGRYLAGEPIAARARSPARRLASWAARRPALSAMLVAVLISALAAGAMMLREKAEARRGAAVAARYGQVAAEIAATMRFEHLLALHDTAPARRRLAARLARLEAEWRNAPPSARAAGRLALGRGHLALGRLDRALELLDEAWAFGPVPPAAALILAEAELERYRRDRAAAEEIEDPTLRSSRLLASAARSRERALALHALAGERSQRGDLVAAQIAFLEGARERAEELAAAALEIAPWRYEAHWLRAEIELAGLADARGRGDSHAVVRLLEAAKTHLRSAAEVAPSDPASHLELCRLAALEVELRLHDIPGSGDRAAASGLADCRRARLADSTSPEAPIAESTLRVVQARDLSRRDEDPFVTIDAAIDAAERAVALAKGNARARRRLADAWIFRAEFERERGFDSSASLARAMLPLERAIELSADDAGVWNSLGLLRWEEVLLAGRRSEDIRPATRGAIEAFSRAVAIEPDHAYAWGNLGTMHNWLAGAEIELGGDALAHLESADQALRRALEIYPAYVTARNNLGNVEHNRGEVLLARAADARPAFRRAVEQFDRVAKSKPDWAFPRFNRARSGIALALAKLRHGDDPGQELDAARRALTAALALRSDLVDAHLLMAELETTQARRDMSLSRSPSAALEAARRAIERARQLDPGAGAEQEDELHRLER